MRNLCAFIILLSSVAAQAAPQPKVFFFGGYKASAAQMKCWEQGAYKHPQLGGLYTFQGIPYPVGASSSASSATSVGAAAIKKVVAEINTNPTQNFVIVGHSSGAALSNAVAAQVKNPKQVELVDLDGFTPSMSLQNKMPTTCWYAQNKKNGLYSNNAGAMKNNCKNSQAFQNTTCNTKWCLHFALVVKSAPPNLGTDFPTNGYKGCHSNLDWLL